MSSRTVWLISAALLALLLGLRAADPPAVETMRHAVFDAMQRLSPERDHDAGIRIVDVDDESLVHIGPWPWPRTVLAALVQRLAELGAAAIAFDAVFADSDPAAPGRVLPLWRGAIDDQQLRDLLARLPDPDAAFAEALSRAPSVLAVALTATPTERGATIKASIAERGPDSRPALIGFRGVLANVAALEAAASGIGNITITGEPDGTVRRVPLLVALARNDARAEIVPTLGLEAVRLAQGAAGIVIETDSGGGVQGVRAGSIVIPTDAQARLWLRTTRGRPETRVIPAWRLLAGEVDPAAFGQAIVFVGAHADAPELRATPLGPATPRVAIHARVAEQIRLGSHLHRPDWVGLVEMAALLALGGALLVVLARNGAARALATGAAATLAGLVLAYLALRWRGLLVEPLYPTLGAMATSGAAALLLTARVGRTRQRLRAAFDRHVGPEAITRLVADPSRLDLAGETRDMTILFCGMRDFPHLADSLDAAGAAQLLNRWLTFVSEIIARHNGTVGRYMGDRIMAFWNAPLDDPDHARHAARAALEIAAAIERLNRDLSGLLGRDGRGVPIGFGLGLNTGACCVGDLGSALRFEYSAIGPAVDHAERLEDQAKAYGVPIVIGETTRARLDGFAVLELDRLHLKSRDRPVRVFALIGDGAVAGEVWFRAMAEAQAALLTALRGRDWQRAVGLVELCRWAAAGRFTALWDFYAARVSATRRLAPEREPLSLVVRN